MNVDSYMSDAFRKKTKIFLIGPSGSGKTVIARKLAPMLFYDAVDVDRLIVEQSGGISIPEIFERFGESHFRKRESEVIGDIIADERKTIIATGGGLPTIEGMMEKLCANGLTVYLKAEVGTLWGRLDSEPDGLNSRPLLRQHGIDQLKLMVMNREPIYNASHLTFRTDSLSVDEVCAALRAVINQN